jgi:hypothetical protein
MEPSHKTFNHQGEYLELEKLLPEKCGMYCQVTDKLWRWRMRPFAI